MTLPILKLIGGLSLFLYGMDLVSEGLQKVAAQKLRVILNLMSRHRLRALFLGAIATITLQSSSAISVMLISFVNSSLLNLDQALTMLLGANIGTTLTIQVLAFDWTGVALATLALGFLGMKSLESDRWKSFALGLVGFSLLFYGMGLMNQAVQLLKDTPWIEGSLSLLGSSFWMGFLAGAFLTALVHSSAATIVIVMTLVNQGAWSFSSSIPPMLGANVGTCVTALMASPGRGPNAWRLSLGHFSMKIVGVLMILPFLSWFEKCVLIFTEFFWEKGGVQARFVANAHVLFNVITSIVLLPGTKWAARLLSRLIHAPSKKEPFNLSEEGMAGVEKGVSEMGDRVEKMIFELIALFRDNDPKILRKIVDADEEVDLLNFELTRFLIQKVTTKFGTEATEHELRLLYAMDQLEHVGDLISKDLAELARKKIRKDLEFSLEGQGELEEFHRMVYNLFRESFAAFIKQDQGLAHEIFMECEEAKKWKTRLHLSHLERLRKEIRETIATSAIYLDLITDLDRIVDHAINFIKVIGI
ncbi:MAG: Na/Pi cotransporter family protein [Chlamydiae bacterium]|nr:Na/Pi cotransporter family protein [Chlamydiota bacterium]MBI3277166.1 Na/Pi cotransporter family protein [Chlamydiota bacterium]